MLNGCGATSPPAETALLPTPTLRPATTSVPPTPIPSPTATPVPPTATPPPTAALAPPTPTTVPFALKSGAFGSGDTVPQQYTCDGENISPPLSWNEPPSGAQSFALIVDDPDAVQVAGIVWVHWVLYNVPASTRSLPENVPADAQLSDGSLSGTTSFKRMGYGGPCPPPGFPHHYVFSLYALDTGLNLAAGATKEEVLQAMPAHILAQTELVGIYERK
ncbi:MAG: YbhB/YbcL family Raf kinase inhibitor-like protein [Anaerolineae bacterium]|nr:YbhB/YbcL family Raf kinase inhibitor-like protein [Anaerolineae bacterium]